MRLDQPGPEEATVGDRRDDVAGPAHRGEAEIRAVRLGVAADVHGPPGQPRAEADEPRRRDVVGMVVLDDDRLAAGELVGERLRPPRRQARARRVLGAGLQHDRPHVTGRERGAQSGHRRAVVVDVDTDHVAAELVEEVEHRREAGVLDDDPVTEAQHDLGDAVDGVHRTVDDGHRLGRERPRAAQLVLEGREDRVVEVARRQRLLADPRHDGTEVGQQRRVRRAGRQVELEVPGAFGDPPVAARSTGTRRWPDVRAVAAARLDRAHGGQRVPGLADRRRRHAELRRQLAHRRQPGADRQLAGRDHPADDAGDAPRAARLAAAAGVVGDARDDVAQHGRTVIGDAP